MGILQNRELAGHPGMNVALHRNELRFVILLDIRRRAGGLRFVPLAIDRRARVNVVRRLVVIDDLQFLIDLKRQNVRRVVTALLIKCGGR